MKFTLLPPLSLYIHLPWCEKKCPYCDFNSHVPTDFDEKQYIKALIEDLQQDLPLIWGRPITSIFIGGGTPSLFSGAVIQQLLSDLRACLNLSPAIEITMEANPGSADEANFKEYRQAGINRLSIGVQSFNNESLLQIGRIHNPEQALSAVAKARQAGFENINLDIMYGLPGQDLAQCLSDISQAIELKPQHISLYQLTIEPNTQFHTQTPQNIPNDDLCWDMQQQAQQLLSESGFAQYEISAYAQPAKQSQHNLNYWQFGDYIGIGAGAHGKITLPSEQRIIRRTRIRQPQNYLTNIHNCVSQQRELNEEDAVFEFMLNALRLTQGFNNELFSEHAGLPFSVLENPLRLAEEKGLLSITDSSIKPTALGLQFHNDLQSLFLNVKLPDKNQVEPEIRF